MAIKSSMLLIYNPIAGKGRSLKEQPYVLNTLDALGAEYQLVETTAPGHATELARNAGLMGFPIVVSVGGDGTVNEVINGLMAAHLAGDPVAVLGLLPLGRGNDFSVGAGIPKEIDRAIALLNSGVRRPLDVGLVSGGDYPEGKYFANGIGIGFDTLVGLHAAELKKIGGALSYVIGALKTFIQYPKAPQVCISWEGGQSNQKAHQISVMNGRRMGGLFWMAPNTSIHDGRFDACFSQELKRWPMLTGIVAYIRKTQHRRKDFTMVQSSWFNIEAPEGGLVVHADGETISVNTNSIRVHCIQGCLEILSGQV